MSPYIEDAQEHNIHLCSLDLRVRESKAGKIHVIVKSEREKLYIFIDSLYDVCNQKCEPDVAFFSSTKKKNCLVI